MSTRLGCFIGLILSFSGSLSAQTDGIHPPDSIVSVFNDYIYQGIPLVAVLPTHEEDQAAQQQIHDYVRGVFSGFEVEFLTDEEAGARSLAGKNILAYGTITGNTWLAEHAAFLPIQVEPDYINADEIIEGPDLRLMAVWDNPDDPDRGLLVCTAQQTSHVVGIHDIHPGAVQFLIARERQILKEGYYIRSEHGWDFSELPDYCPDLTIEQKLEDFDTLTEIIRDVFPAAHVNKMVYGLDIEQIFADYRLSVAESDSMLDFITILDRTLNACKGSHMNTDYVGSEYYATNEFLRFYAADYLNEDIVRIHQIYYTHLLTRDPSYTVRLNVPFIYHQGDYYVQYDIFFENSVFVRGLKVETCNGITPDDIVAEHQDSLAMLPWDFTYGKFYDTRFYAMRDHTFHERLDFVFRTPDGETVRASFPLDGTVTFNAPLRESGRKVEYLPESQLLYIRIPSMNTEDIPFYEDGILREGRSGGRQARQVQAAVVDIRNNGGGSDSVWNSVLNKLLDRPVSHEMRYAVRNTNTVRSYISRHYFGSTILQSGRPETVDFLGEDEYLTTTSRRTLSPASDSVRVPKIYVLSDNVYSSAGSLTTLAGLIEAVVSVGYTNPHILGMGIDPFHFSLPHSSYAFTIEPVIDITNCSSPVDVFHANVEVEVRPTLEEVLDFYNQPMEGSLEDFLTGYDPVFQEVLHLMEASATGQ